MMEDAGLKTKNHVAGEGWKIHDPENEGPNSR